MTKEEAARYLGRLGGLKGGPARMAKMTDEQKSELGKKAAKARWDKYRAGQAEVEAAES